MGKKEGTAKPVSISLYQEHIEIINDAIINAGCYNPANFVQTIIEDYKHRDTGVLRQFLMLVIQPFLIIIFMMLYSFEANLIWLNLISGVLASAFWYYAYKFTLMTRGIDPRTHFKSKKKRMRGEQ